VPSLSIDHAGAHGGPAWLEELRDKAQAELAACGLPDPSDEVWRYSPIGELELDRFSLADEAAAPSVKLPSSLAAGSAVFEIRAGRATEVTSTIPGVSVMPASTHPEGAELVASISGVSESLVALNMANLADPLIIDVSRGALVDIPIVLIHQVPVGASFPRSIIRMGEGSQASVIEVALGGGEGTLNVPVTELDVSDQAILRHASIQLLERGSWHLSTIGARIGRDATLSQFTAGLGASYDRCRTDAVLAGQGASSVLRSTYLGDGEQIHDLRTLQDHAAPKTISDLLCKGAVTDSSRSVYSGLIKVRHGATRSDAMQTNHNLVLSEAAHADSVPNLDIKENDVRCSHASTVGPIDEDQRYYLESRGIEPDEAQRLLVRGFFTDLLTKTPMASAAELVGAEISQRLDGMSR